MIGPPRVPRDPSDTPPVAAAAAASAAPHSVAAVLSAKAAELKSVKPPAVNAAVAGATAAVSAAQPAADASASASPSPVRIAIDSKHSVPKSGADGKADVKRTGKERDSDKVPDVCIMGGGHHFDATGPVYSVLTVSQAKCHAFESLGMCVHCACLVAATDVLSNCFAAPPTPSPESASAPAPGSAAAAAAATGLRGRGRFSKSPAVSLLPAVRPGERPHRPAQSESGEGQRYYYGCIGRLHGQNGWKACARCAVVFYAPNKHATRCGATISAIAPDGLPHDDQWSMAMQFACA
jgi:hypothetical protein